MLDHIVVECDLPPEYGSQRPAPTGNGRRSDRACYFCREPDHSMVVCSSLDALCEMTPMFKNPRDVPSSPTPRQGWEQEEGEEGATHFASLEDGAGNKNGSEKRHCRGHLVAAWVKRERDEERGRDTRLQQGVGSVEMDAKARRPNGS